MTCYTVTVATGGELYAGTNARIYLTLIGTENSSERTLLDKFFHIDFKRGAVDSYSIKAAEDLGDIVLVKLENKKYKLPDAWYCRNLTVKTPSGETWEFPCYRWVGDEQEVVLREGRAILPQDDKSSLLKDHRCKELHTMQTLFRWHEWQPGFPLSISAKSYSKLPPDVQFTDQKTYDFTTNQLQVFQNMKINDFLNVVSSWSNFDDFKKLFLKISNAGSEYVMQHWQEDYLFAYQYLNGCNPVMIRKCTEIPAKFPVTHAMVEFCLERGLTLEEEVKAGNIYIVDYEIMENITPNTTDSCTTCCLAAPICLLYRNAKNEILPIAIQLGQSPGENCPIFLPNDGKFDWMLAKMWVRSTDFHVHQTNTHLLGTHLITEVFAVAMYRQLAAVHPIYKLLRPHIRFTIAINAQARESLVGPGGIFDKIMAIGGGGHVELARRATKRFTYQSLVFPEAIKARGMDSQEDLPYYFYRDDGYKVWEAIRSFVEDVVHIYYKSDEAVVEDEEIQAFVKDVCSSGMRDQDQSGFPKSLKNREQLIEYLTAVIFNSSAQHAAVNFGQFEWSSWVPNAPSNMRKPPPTKKGVVDLKYIMESLPNRARSSQHMGVVWALSQYQSEELYLGMYPDELFTEKPVVEAMKKFRKSLAELSRFIKTRNEGKMMPYRYMSPDRIPNSVAV